MNTALKSITIAVLSLCLGSCAASARRNPEIFQVGELEIRLYQDREKMARDLPTLLTLVEATKVGDKQVNVLGYFDRQNKRIYAIDNARIVIHEFKHYLEPAWRHKVGTSYLQESPDESK